MKPFLTALMILAAGGHVAAAEEAAAGSPTTNLRVGGDMVAVAKWDAHAEEWKSGSSFIDTPLPVGYPAPTPPGAIEIKSYPAVRRAEIGVAGNRGFMPLFRHIQRHDIAMTSPVEMDYSTSNTVTLQTTSMSFLYRTPELNGTGPDPKDPRVAVRDAQPTTVVSLGGRGSYENDRVAKDIVTLRDWLAEHPEYKAVGEPRALMYNGPTPMPWRKWLEVQIPVAKAEPAAAPEAPAAP